MRRRELLISSDEYEYVDLDLPSGLLWSIKNIAADNPENTGNYYQFGAGTVTYSNYNQYYTGTTDPLPASVDTATLTMGGDWKTPTRAQCQELIDNTNATTVSINNINCIKYTSKVNNSKYIIIPKSGYYYNGSLKYNGTNMCIWTSNKYNNTYGYYMYNQYGSTSITSIGKNYGMPVRGIKGSGKLTLSSASTTVNGSSGNTTFKVYFNSELLTASTVSVTSNQAWVTASWSASSSTVTLNYTTNSDLDNSRTANITVTYNGQSQVFYLIQSESQISLYMSSYDFYSAGDTYGVEFKINGITSSPGEYEVYPLYSYITIGQKNTSYFIFVLDANRGERRPVDIKVVTHGNEYYVKDITYNKYQAGTDAILSLRFSDGNVYSFNNWPSNGIPIGIVIPNANACISLNYMSQSSPETGKVGNEHILFFGGYGYGPFASDYYDGKANTTALLAHDNSYSTAWQTASNIDNTNNNEYIHPAARSCWMYHTAGTNKGDWYLPARNQLNYILNCDTTGYYYANYVISNTRLEIDKMYRTNYGSFYDSESLLSSTEYNSVYVYTSSSSNSHSKRDSSSVVAMLDL